MRLVATKTSLQGYVLDYVEINTEQADYTFQADTTYYISGYNDYDSITLKAEPF